MGKILVIDDEKYIGWIIKKTFEATDNDVFACQTAKEGLMEAQKNSYDIVFLDLRLPDMDGMEVLTELKKIQQNLVVIIITAHGSIDTAIESMKKGAFDYITKPFDVDELLIQVEKAHELQKLKEEIDYLRNINIKEIDEINLKSKNENLNTIYKSLEQVARSPATVLIMGETGTGKQLIAKKIHKLSDRTNYPFVTLNCSTTPESALEKEILGYEKGTFPGAADKKKGKLELAGKGTIFIEEIDKLSLKLQIKLINILNEREFQRIGQNGSMKFEARIIAASNRDLVDEINEGRFREDLYYKLNVFPIKLPPLRERREDLLDLVDYFIKKHDSSHKIKGISPDTVRMLKSYHWPGNIIELENVIERIIILNQDPLIKPGVLPEEILGMVKSSKDPIIYFPEEGINLENVERELIIKALKISGQNQSKAAQLLGITRSALIYRMQKYAIK